MIDLSPEFKEALRELTPHNEHYKELPFEPLAVMRDLLTQEEYIGFIKGNILKYRLRAGHKGEAQSDIDKAMYYERLLRNEGE